MNRLDDRIAELCPDGVEYRALGDVIRVDFGTRITKAKDAGTAYPVYGGGGESFRTDTYNREDEWVISRFAMSKNCVRRVQGRFWMLDSGFTFEIVSNDVMKDYLGQVLLNMQPTIYKTATQSAQKNIDIEGFKRLRVPVPPMEIQRETVRTLEQFAALEADLKGELRAELEARRRQYAHYRDTLTTAGDIGTWRPMRDLGTFIRGRRFTKNDLVAEGIASIHYGDIYTAYGVSTTSTVSHVREDMRDQLRYAQPGDVVIAGVGETVEDVGKAVAWLGDGEVAVHDDTFLFRHDMNPKFVAYVLQTPAFHAQKERHVSRAKMKRLSSRGLSMIAIPVPPVEEQKRIVAILDRFDALVNDLSVSLHIELDARGRQFEHYRDHRLTFEERVE